ncbi:RNA polymerase sigma factor CnrH [Pirellula sp. SH-Sr6A]|uniref:RNA polymerase sigma factor n=1 Tax=Pirellula sp. SH-Sr6A TaxID=1632865 RepID=UPI00078C6BF3|nr:sigma-70 family RNA polymerase sigma factor [Pirellula sp. SH-Sr6A]AMV34782.1 RNA polymerase sigma factor CnrH [Pirellula sp. SH-Sr6A]
MSSLNTPVNPERILVDSIRAGDTDAWRQLIDRYEGRLLAFVSARLLDRSHAEDIVQDTFLGFLNSLPNYDCERPLEGYLFSIAAYKLTDHLRKLGRRQATSFTSPDGSSDGAQQAPAPYRAVSSIVRSVERRDAEELALVDALREQISKWKGKEDWKKLKCIELLFVAGMSNKEIAERLAVTEQQVANYKSDFILRTKTLLSRLANRESFPELG